MSLKKAPVNLLRARLPKFRQLAPDGRRSGYNYMAFFHLQGIEFKIYYWNKPKKAGAMIEVTSPSPASLEDLWKRLKALHMTSVEYAIDFKCKEAADAPLVHWLLRRYIRFANYTGPVTSAGRVFTGIDDEGDENSVSYFWDNVRKYIAVKIYERGLDLPDDEKRDGKPSWSMDCLDRVRLEFTFKNDKAKEKRKRLNVKYLNGFRRCPRMLELLDGQFAFSVFKKGNHLPREWDHYPELDASGGIESFHVEWLAAANKVSNPYQCYRDSVLMAPLMKKIQLALKDYDQRWTIQADKARMKVGTFEGKFLQWEVI
ncbi:hypothetical protein SYK_31140 [Pseudodesulfovibrio nedwellii]|uniref:Uncharacterized protein n=1 Tax=Pseudodesulfovibrio nedwellii TaxID=2973072 RepID=A0ABM8B4L1_9BACT|nr:hypothetical protein [Pseudodesulfovibrio nedwellii]BDQ38754.1 hypothetical protein SYK_31140 [Pseudodesulfovibrio nedwellii]